ncbi:hypothetical protein EV215_1553 [Hypnocyclicus thermotrophus]|uniref:Uncharacterized protein n=1 Tax=Hypnocyclicus thermotrophus TaxID=1627895 RepID=A0AA46I591_9FUSO|nr:hypothetical protein [Hypnocyclicus thermotrophus]TDT69211.1 hypothetical protein EV215_1553 [Hypnocyclicus thermotrophus]
MIFQKLKISSRLITFLDIIVIVFMFIFLKSYFSVHKYSYTTKKNGLKIVSTIRNKKLNQNNFMIINLTIQNTTRKDKIIEINRKNIFNIIVEKDNKVIYKSDILDIKRERSKKIKLAQRGELKLSYEWDLTSNFKEEITTGNYKVTVYSLDLDISHSYDIEIIEEEN